MCIVKELINTTESSNLKSSIVLWALKSNSEISLSVQCRQSSAAVKIYDCFNKYQIMMMVIAAFGIEHYFPLGTLTAFRKPQLFHSRFK